VTAGGAVVWFTGAPSAGKSKLARSAAGALRERGCAVAVLDGDELRAVLTPKPGYDDAGRDAFYETLGALAALLATQGLLVLVAATAHRRSYRERARERAPRFIEVFVDASEAERRERDSKGLYRAEAAGGVTGLPGGDLQYERPSNPDVHAHGGKDEGALQTLLGLLA
jgi:adenylylsulfate kinase